MLRISKKWFRDNIGEFKRSGYDWFCSQDERDGLKVIEKLIREDKGEWSKRPPTPKEGYDSNGTWITTREFTKWHDSYFDWGFYKLGLAIDIMEELMNEKQDKVYRGFLKKLILDSNSYLKENSLAKSLIDDKWYDSCALGNCTGGVTSIARHKIELKIIKFGLSL